MIIFDLDGTLADCEHRRHFVDPMKWVGEQSPFKPMPKFISDWQSFYEACDKDAPIQAVTRALRLLGNHDDWEIWSGRDESVREKTIEWLYDKIPCFSPKRLWNDKLKMRPIGDSTPDDQLKEEWLEDHIRSMGNQMVHDIDFVFDSDADSIRMWRRRGIFVFNCAQNDPEF